VGAALLSASIQRWLSAVPEHSCLFARARGGRGRFVIVPPAGVAAELNRRFHAEPESGRFFTLLYGVLDRRDGSFRYATAGHPPPLRASADGVEVCPSAVGVPIGVLEDFDYQETGIRLRVGERLLLYTDGAVEAADAHDEIYGVERLQRILGEQARREPDAALATVMADLRAWGGSGGLEDDITLLAVDAVAEQPAS
jgi:sigma-B regulation protein RsbU (phosphoserine phosphatase)